MSQTKEITIQGLAFEVATPYVAGHVVTEAEAKALNQVRLENIRNNMASTIKEAKGDAESISQEVYDQLKAAVAEYDGKYEFTLASVGGGKRSSDPVETEARRLAKSAISAKLSADGRTLKSVDPDKLAAAIAKLAESEEIVKEAKRIVKARTASAASAMAELDL